MGYKNDGNWITFTHADQIEDYSEYLSNRCTHYLLDHSDINKEKFDIILDFVDYCIEQNNKDLDIPRGREKTSFNQRRAAQLKEEVEGITLKGDLK